MQPASMRALGSSEGQEKASKAANSGGSKKSDSATASYLMSGVGSTAALDPKTRNQKSNRTWKITIRRRASHRLAELYRLAAFYRRHRIPTDTSTWAFVLATTLGAGKPAWLPVRRGQRDIRWPGLTHESLRTAVDRCGLEGLSDDDLVALISKVEGWQSTHGIRLIGMRRLGEMLNLTAAEREVCSIRTIDACDETRAERQARLAEARKARERDAKKARRDRVPRELYEAQSLSAKQPWAEAGVSRATWYRQRKGSRETGVSEHQISSLQPHRTHLSQGLLAARAAGPARTDSASLSDGAGVPSAQGLPRRSLEAPFLRTGPAQPSLGRGLMLHDLLYRYERLRQRMGGPAHA
jgi:hypothetical protein